ncbi:hypothetical protein BY458DRAFT_549717 [Sporodiniella umbellata]|nr:hypothetical protein BY458DRAFT_549717 [Sporodiniella umbellata]
MIFDRYRNKSKKAEENTVKKSVTTSSLANALLKRFPIQLSKKPKHCLSEKNDKVKQPRPSISLPNINAAAKQGYILVPMATLPRKQRKRHSAEQQLQCRRTRQTFTMLKDNHSRHSFTFGHSSKANHDVLTLTDLSLGPIQRAKLDKLTISIKQSDPQDLLSKVGNGPLTPHRSISHQYIQLSPPYPTLNRTHSESRIKTQGVPIQPKELIRLIEDKTCSVTLIDVRNLMDYQKRRIRYSLNVNLPSLLIKRYQRGTVSNFNLENFITTPEGRDLYLTSQLAKVRKVWVVYDEEMSEGDQSSQAWTLLKVLERFHKNQGQVYYLSGGFQAFEHKEWIDTDSSAGTDISDQHHTIHKNNQMNPKLSNIPRRSVSYTIGDSKNHRYTSLFSLDTQAARANNANALARRAKRQSQQESILAHAQPDSILNCVNEDDDELITASPRTGSEFNFVISEIIRGFLYVGPEIETKDQAQQLENLQIKRVLNMAEECQDEGLDKNVVYHKISARDTVEMKNIELFMMEAVHFIEEAKRNNEPIYVHCKAGKSRSITAILAYLVTSEKWTLKQAYRHVIKVRPSMSPNIGFIAELMKMESRVHGRTSSFLETDWQTNISAKSEKFAELQQLEKLWQDDDMRIASDRK